MYQRKLTLIRGVTKFWEKITQMIAQIAMIIK